LFGNDTPSIELDAIHPNQLRQLVRDALEQHLPDGWLDRIEQEEQAARETLADIAQHWAA
jgi:hypothetical protein